jgi:hypothetical protein
MSFENFTAIYFSLFLWPPFLVTGFFIIKAISCKQYGDSPEMMARAEDFKDKARKWGRITIISWIFGFLTTALLVFAFHK